jgi:hypothetical protein
MQSVRDLTQAELDRFSHGGQGYGPMRMPANLVCYGQLLTTMLCQVCSELNKVGLYKDVVLHSKPALASGHPGRSVRRV